MIIACIYQIKCLENNKIYIGYTINFNIRKNKHLSALRNNVGHCESLQLDFNKFGEHNFEFLIIKETDDKNEEKNIILEYSENHLLYNRADNPIAPKILKKHQEILMGSPKTNEKTMQLKDWLEINGHSQIWFAKKIGVSQQKICNLINNVCEPSIIDIWNIQIITDGEVKISDWVNQIKAARKK